MRNNICLQSFACLLLIVWWYVS